MAAANRLAKEYKEILKSQSNPKSIEESGIFLKPISESDLYSWSAYIIGPVDTPFDGGKFNLRITVPRSYPIQPPKVIFTTRICHPNIHFKTGEICLDLLKDNWSPIWTLEATLRAVQALLSSPEASSPLNCDAGNLVRAGDIVGYESLARMYTLEFAEMVRKPKVKNYFNTNTNTNTTTNKTNTTPSNNTKENDMKKQLADESKQSSTAGIVSA